MSDVFEARSSWLQGNASPCPTDSRPQPLFFFFKLLTCQPPAISHIIGAHWASTSNKLPNLLGSRIRARPRPWRRPWLQGPPREFYSGSGQCQSCAREPPGSQGLRRLGLGSSRNLMTTPKFESEAARWLGNWALQSSHAPPLIYLVHQHPAFLPVVTSFVFFDCLISKP